MSVEWLGDPISFKRQKHYAIHNQTTENSPPSSFFFFLTNSSFAKFYVLPGNKLSPGNFSSVLSTYYLAIKTYPYLCTYQKNSTATKIVPS